jgi:gamma-glutamylcyclotransferase (GGCT)/AIG2-like uncharacterized protein YtfP
MKHLIFVYGSLRSGASSAMAARFPGSRFIGDATVRGSLYDLGAYPGLLLNESNGLVVGEVFQVDDEVLRELDDFEAPSSYWRKQVEVSVGCEKKTCWIYVPDYDAEFYSQHTLVTSGDWVEYAKEKNNGPGTNVTH